ncbi:FMN-binding protein [Alkalibacterium sp. f15]|uniref:FMN-binding protein n=1 Tax=Alkalibacterium sp. f15 TaxID=3414029 RepID=UPI003BF8A9C9
MKKLLKISAVLIGLMLIVAAGFLIYATRGLDRDIPLEGRGAAELEDGRYQGEYEGGRWSNKVEVVVENGEITDIIIIEDMLFTTAEFSQGIIENVLENQQTDTDVVTGSTVTSRAYLKAIENALDP